MAHLLQITLPDGRKVQAVEVGVTKANEHWNEYELEDGNTVKIKTILVKMMKVVDAKNELTGEPIYFSNTQNLMTLTMKGDKK
jgi:hypothetical protein